MSSTSVRLLIGLTVAVITRSRDCACSGSTASTPETLLHRHTELQGGVPQDTLSSLERQFIGRLGLDRTPRPAFTPQLHRVPGFLKQLMQADRTDAVTSSCPDQSPLSAVALSPSIAVVTPDGYRSTYNVSKLLRQSFNNVELVLASWTTSSSSSRSVRGTVALATDDGVTGEVLTLTLQTPTLRQHGYDRYNLTTYFENIRQQTSNHQYSHVVMNWQTSHHINRTDIVEELLVFYNGEAAASNSKVCQSPHPSRDDSERPTGHRSGHHRSRRHLRPTSFTAAAADAEGSASGSSCRLHRWYLDFERLGWTRWVRIPRGYYANYCSGTCRVTPGGVTDNATTVSNHAFVKGLYLAATNRSDLAGPRSDACCVSLRLSPINILYNNDEGQWVMTKMAEMIADECGCL